MLTEIEQNYLRIRRRFFNPPPLPPAPVEPPTPPPPPAEFTRDQALLLAILERAPHSGKHLMPIERVIRAVCGYYGVKRRDLVSESRLAYIVHPRQITMHLCRRLTGRSLPEIGRRLGNRDHTTVLHGDRKIAALRLTDAVLDAELRELEAALSADGG